jgi:hypothetical protein
MYQMWDPTTSPVHKTRYVIWMKCMFYSKLALMHDFAVVKDGINIV